MHAQPLPSPTSPSRKLFGTLLALGWAGFGVVLVVFSGIRE